MTTGAFSPRARALFLPLSLSLSLSVYKYRSCALFVSLLHSLSLYSLSPLLNLI